MNKQPDPLKCALMILYDECPPDNKAYFCMVTEELGDNPCVDCWSHYLFYGAYKPEQRTKRIKR